MCPRANTRARRNLKGSPTATNTFEPTPGTDTIRTKGGSFITISTKLFNICANSKHGDKSMEELRFEYYTNNQGRNFCSACNASTSSTIGSPFFATNFSRAGASGCFPFGVPFPPPTLSPTLLFTFGNKQTTTSLTFDFASAIKELNDRFNDLNRVRDSPRSCAECDSPPQVQCLHCFKPVCLECAQKHVGQTTKEIEATAQTLIAKASVLDQLASAAKERVNLEREKLIQQADIVREQACLQIDELHEQLKKQLEDKHTRLQQVSLDQVSSLIRRMTVETEEFNENNEDLFQVQTTPATIVIKSQYSSANAN